MKKCFEVKGKHLRIVDKENLILKIDDGLYVDINGNSVPEEARFKESSQVDDWSDDPWDSYWLEYEGLDEKLISKSTTEVEKEIDDWFGNYGFINKSGEFVIEPQFAYAHEFTCGLAAVNLNRTWYKTPEGRRYYENHYGYINNRGETVIPFAYDEAWPFNKYGVAVVEPRTGPNLLIDTNGDRIPGTEKLSFSHYYDYEERYIEFSYYTEEFDYEEPVGIYDTKTRKILLEPTIDSFTEESENLIQVWDRNSGEYGYPDFREYYINGEGEKLYPWLIDKGFAIVNVPNDSSLSVVAVSKFIELPDDYIGSHFPINGKKYEREFIYGVYSSEEKFVIPLEYENIYELAENIFACFKSGVFTIFKYE